MEWARHLGAGVYTFPTIDRLVPDERGRAKSGEIPKRPTGSDCKSDGTAFTGSNPVLPKPGRPEPRLWKAW